MDILLMAGLGFFGSFGHCLGMCGPITVAFSLGAGESNAQRPWFNLRFHLLLNLGRLVSYALVGAAIGGLGSILVAGGQMAGLGSGLRQGMTIFTGLLLIWFGLRQVSPGLLPKLPMVHPLRQTSLHGQLTRAMERCSTTPQWWTPMLLGLCWGLIPCGFLYAAQIKAAETTQLWGGALTMLAFGLGTLPMMAGIGLSTSWLSHDRRGQLFQLGGWITLLVGVLTLTRSGESMTDYAGYGGLGLLVLALVARPISKIWSGPLRYRRIIGVGAFILSLAHTVQVVQHSWNGNLRAIAFMLPHHQWGIMAGAGALILMLPLALTSSDWAQRQMKKQWRALHLLSVPALWLGISHGLLLGSRYGRPSPGQLSWMAVALLLVGLGVMLARSRALWQLFSLESYYAPPRDGFPKR